MYRNGIKRLLAVILSLCGMIVLSPLLLILCLAIKIDSPGPIFFRQKRVGIHKQHFNILKFRTMRIDTWHDTVTAEVVTAVHNINTGFKRIFTHSRQFFHHFFCAVPDVDNLVFLCPSAVEQFCQLENVECTEHNVDKAVRLLDFFNNLCFLHHTAAQCDNHMRIFLF